jgi:hypothetical protein
MRRVGFEHATPVFERTKTVHALEGAAAVISGISLKSKHKLQYPSLPSTVRPVLQSQDLPVPKLPEKWTTDDNKNHDESVRMEQDVSEPDVQPSTNKPHLISQGELNDVIGTWTYLKVKLNSWDCDCKAGTCCRKIQIFQSYFVDKKLFSILLQLVIWFTVQILRS